MSDAFMGIDIASRALRAFQMALNVTGHNLANVETKGFSRQRAVIGQTPPITFYGARPLTFGTGSFIDTVERIRDRFLDGRFLQTTSDGERLRQTHTSLSNLEGVFGDPGSAGIHFAMTGMFDAWSRLNANPADDAARLSVRMNSGLFVQRIREVDSQLMSYDRQLNSEVAGTISAINELGQKIAELNKEIRVLAHNQAAPNDLLDRRDLAIEQLAGLVDLQTVERDDGSKLVLIGGHALVDQIGNHDLPTTYDAASSTLTDGSKTILIRGGRLAGLFGGIVAVSNYQAQLDTLVDEVRLQVNLLHATGVNLNGTTGIDFFSGSGGAGDLDLTDDIKDDLRNIAAGTSGEPGDGSLAAAIAAVRDTTFTALGDRSPVEYYSDAISRLGQETAYYRSALHAQDAMLSQIEQQRQAVMGVNMDEELSNMLRYQRSYQAAARFLSVLDKTTEELITQLGR